MNFRTHIKILAVLASLLLVFGCQKGDITETIEETDKEICFGVSLGTAQTATRAIESTNAILQAAAQKDPIPGKTTGIPIFAYRQEGGAKGFAPYFADALDYDNNQWVSLSGASRFLPDVPMNLYAYYATELGKKADLLGITNYTPASGTSHPTFDFEVDRNEHAHVDLIAAKVESVANPNLIIPFRHILSQVNFGVKGVNDAKISVYNIRITGVSNKATFNYGSWAWTGHTSPTTQPVVYHFPDWNSTNLGNDYFTPGDTDDADKVFVFGDGGHFGPDATSPSPSPYWYAQLLGTSGYKQKAYSDTDISNSLMLIPQEITQNDDAIVTFDYVVKKNDTPVKSGKDVEISLSSYYDWLPNFRYVYVFNFDIPTESITFDVIIKEWQNWDYVDDANPGTGLVNSALQQIKASQINGLTNGKTLYLEGRVAQNLAWDWSGYTFSGIPSSGNAITLDFYYVRFDTGKTITLTLPPGFTASGEALKPDGTIGNSKKLTIKKD